LFVSRADITFEVFVGRMRRSAVRAITGRMVSR